ncbi:hypothetical protein ACHWUR_28570 [Klebsiella pneumoniae]
MNLTTASSVADGWCAFSATSNNQRRLGGCMRRVVAGAAGVVVIEPTNKPHGRR